MKTLGEIIDQVKEGKKPEYDEIRYAVCALDSLLTFDGMAFRKLAEGEMESKKKVLVYSAEWQYEDNFNRNKRAFSTSPKDWLGWNNNPDNPEYVNRRKNNIKLMENILRKTKE